MNSTEIAQIKQVIKLYFESCYLLKKLPKYEQLAMVLDNHLKETSK